MTAVSVLGPAGQACFRSANASMIIDSPWRNIGVWRTWLSIVPADIV